MRFRIRQIIRQIGHALHIEIISDRLSLDHLPLYISDPLKHWAGNAVRRLKGSSYKLRQLGFPQLGPVSLGSWRKSPLVQDTSPMR